MKRDKTKRLDADEVRKAVRKNYSEIASRGASSCGCSPMSSCCSPGPASCGPASDTVDHLSKLMGYSESDLRDTPSGSNMGLGCGNPQAIAKLKPGEIVLDLGSGGGFDCFLAARQVGDKGRVIGVDMTAEMIYKARENARSAGFTNAEFRLGEIENLPVADKSVDVIISNCVINLSPDKARVFQEAYRVLKPGGRLSIADVVAINPLPPDIQNNLELLSGCVSGAATIGEIENMLAEVGFQQIKISPRVESRGLIYQWLPDSDIDDYILSATIEAIKPASD